MAYTFLCVYFCQHYDLSTAFLNFLCIQCKVLCIFGFLIHKHKTLLSIIALLRQGYEGHTSQFYIQKSFIWQLNLYKIGLPYEALAKYGGAAG